MSACFKAKFYEDWVSNSIRGLSFLCRLPDIRIAWINPWPNIFYSILFKKCWKSPHFHTCFSIFTLFFLSITIFKKSSTYACFYHFYLIKFGPVNQRHLSSLIIFHVIRHQEYSNLYFVESPYIFSRCGT